MAAKKKIYIDNLRVFRAAENDYGEIVYTMIYEGVARLEESKPFEVGGTLKREYVVLTPDDKLSVQATDQIDLKTPVKDWGSGLDTESRPTQPQNLLSVNGDSFNVAGFGTKIYLKNIYL